MTNLRRCWLTALIGCAVVSTANISFGQPQPQPPARTPTQADYDFFENKVRPVLVNNCFNCHSDEKKVRGGLKMTSRAELLRGGDTGPAIVPGDPDKSLLVQVIRYTGDMKMPPKGKLKDHEIADLTTWVKNGAAWPDTAGKVTPVAKDKGGPLFTDEQRAFWAFQPVRLPPLPAVRDQAWVQSPIDRFILAKLEEKGLRPAPPADKRTLIRRATYDLTGLPPTPEEIDDFLRDDRPDAFARVIDRLLASPAYGERWARHWLDVARYADSNGLDENTAFANAYRYRDYVIRAFNQDKGYDQFILEQLAGDLLPPVNDPQVMQDRIIALGFLVLGPKLLAEPDKPKMVMDIVDEQIDTTTRAFMALTVACARCHDHKFDPIPTRDYYGLAGIFKSTKTMATLNTVARWHERPILGPAADAAIKAHQAAIAAKQQQLNAATEAAQQEVLKAARANLAKYLLAYADLAPAGSLGAAPALMANPTTAKLAGVIVQEAEQYTRGNATKTTTGYGEGIGIIESAGVVDAYAEYDLTIEKPGRYQLELRYASAEARPLEIKLDGGLISTTAASEATGGFNPPQQVWKVVGVIELAAGKRVLRLNVPPGKYLPHVDKIALVPVPTDTASAPAAPKQRPRTATLPQQSQKFGIPAELLDSFAQHLESRRAKGQADPVFGPFFALAELPDTGFAPAAEELVARWRTQKQPWLAPIAQAFTTAPRSLEEVAQRYAHVFGEALNAHMADAAQQQLRQLATQPKDGLFLLPGNATHLYPQPIRKQLQELGKELKNLQKSTLPIEMAMSVQDETPDKIGPVKVHIRGNHLTQGELAPRIMLRIIAGEQQAEVPAGESGRLQLARWLASPDHPLTARVMVNRIWQHHFGEGIVRSVDNFGKLGDRPTHPELLDWLAVHFVQNRWSLKHMHRTIMLSAAYQMSSTYDPQAALVDPDNLLLWRFNRQRLEAEAIRDGILAVAGKLDRTMGGTLLETANFEYVTNDQSRNKARYDSLRRSIYLPVIRNAVYDFFQAYDFVEPSFINGKRTPTVVAQQALFMMNSKFVADQSAAFAQRLLNDPALPDDAARIRQAYRLAYGREPAEAETAAALAFLDAARQRFASAEQDSARREQLAWQVYCQLIFASNEFIYLN